MGYRAPINAPKFPVHRVEVSASDGGMDLSRGRSFARKLARIPNLHRATSPIRV